MKVKYFTESAYTELYDLIGNNTQNYTHPKNDWIIEWANNKTVCKESRIDTVLPALNYNNGDYFNALTIHSAFKDKLNPKQASNPMLWSYLTHFEYWDYTVERWAKGSISNESIKQRFFCGPYDGSRIGLLRNAISRLWWSAELTFQPEKAQPYELTQLLYSHSDIALSVIERNFSMNKEITIGLLSAIKAINDDNNQKDVGISSKTGEYEWRDLCKYINRYGAVTLLDSLTRDDIYELSYTYLLNRR